MAAQSESWPMIEQGIQLGKGGPRRLTLAPGGIADWIVDASSYHPTTKGGNKLFMNRLQKISNDICLVIQILNPSWRNSCLHAADSKFPWIGCSSG